MVQCNGELCNRDGEGTKLPEYHFLESLLNDWQAKQMVAGIKCARCFIRSDDCSRKEEAASKSYTCVSCCADKLLTDMAPIVVKDWLMGQRNHQRWRCYECQYPERKMCKVDIRCCRRTDRKLIIFVTYASGPVRW